MTGALVESGGRSLLHVFIFCHGAMAAMYLQDAITALGVIEVNPSEWHVEDGYPVFLFPSERINDYCARLRGAGYIPGVLMPAEKRAQTVERTERAEVIDIASVRMVGGS